MHYRLGLFDALKTALEEDGYELELVVGTATENETSRQDQGTLDWATVIQNRKILQYKKTEVIWQSLPSHALDADLIICMQENRLISNYPVIARSHFRRAQRVAYWGHGVNLQSDYPNGIREKWKSLWINSVDWWFAYTQLTADKLHDAGFDSSRITILNNAIDNSDFINDLDQADLTNFDSFQ